MLQVPSDHGTWITVPMASDNPAHDFLTANDFCERLDTLARKANSLMGNSTKTPVTRYSAGIPKPYTKGESAQARFTFERKARGA